MIARADSEHQPTRGLKIDPGTVGVLDRDLLEAFNQRNLKCLAHDGDERFVLVGDLNSEPAPVEPGEQRLQDPQRS